jgi:hypothetical protein
MFGAAVFGLAWMMPKTAAGGPKQEFVSEEAYNQLLEDLEAENRELFDAVAKFKREHDETVEKLGDRIVDMERQMKKWSEQSASSTMSAEPRSENAIPLIKSAPESEMPHAAQPILGDNLSNPQETAPSGLNEAAATSAEPESVDQPAHPPTTIRARYSELLGLHDKGRSIEQIAKALGLNKGEVQLILQLARREERHHA